VTELVWLDESIVDFPPIEQALLVPDGLLAAGGDLSPKRLKLAYSRGIFPWFDETQAILWWSPSSRAVLFHDKLKISRSLMKRLRRNEFVIKVDTCFARVIEACSRPRNPLLFIESQSTENSSVKDPSIENPSINDNDDPAIETWITAEMQAAYLQLHEIGLAHSIECFEGSRLVGGLYGVSIGRMFFGESMFHLKTDASKVAFAHLSRLLQAHGCPLIDCQIENAHLTSLGCTLLPRDQFQTYLTQYCDEQDVIPWETLVGALPPW